MIVKGENTEAFTDAEHQLIGMKISYISEENASYIDESSTEAEITQILDKTIEDYRIALNNNNINFVDDVPQYFNTTAEVESSSYLMEGIPAREIESGNHINAITKGDPSNPDESNVL
ncbi:hypothetical protein [Salipaludibacillus agaradhaerens]|uniref:hypothetical protein n=1 Tax=Salipaludibacillus agaradhaerens TaxID=76935 RepID=UPI0009988C15|nr:hypothetical protein [Salipaludibacillus agaradhaerens]